MRNAGVSIDIADVAVIDLLVVVVFDLYHLVAGREGPAEVLDLALAGGIEGGLQLDVERAGAGAAAVHRAQHLNVAHRVEPEALRDSRLYELDDHGDCCFRFVRLHEVEVAVALGLGKIGNGTSVDPVRAGDDPASRRLAEYLGQPHDRNRAGGNEIGQHLTRTDRRQLVDVADDQQSGFVGNRRQQRPHQHDIHHRSLVDDQKSAVERIVGVALEPPAPGIDLKQPVDRNGLEPGGLCHPFGGTAGRRAEKQGHARGAQDAQDRVDDGRLAHARTAGDDHGLGVQGPVNRIGLAFRKPEVALTSRASPCEAVAEPPLDTRRQCPIFTHDEQ